MPGNIIDGERWITERLRFLRQRQAEQLSEQERLAVEHEIGVLSREQGMKPAGRRSWLLLRRLRRR